jgi:hypothetical protein
MAAAIRRMEDLSASLSPAEAQPRDRRAPAICLFGRVSAASLQASSLDEKAERVHAHERARRKLPVTRASG